MNVLIVTLISLVTLFFTFGIDRGCKHEWKHIRNQENRNELIIYLKCSKCKSFKSDTVILS